MVKRFLIILLPLVGLLGGILALFYYIDIRTETNLIKVREIYSVDIQMEAIISDLSSVVSDLLVLSEQHELQRVLEGDEEERRAELRDLTNNFLSFSLRKVVYDQIRFLDDTGMEVVRVNYNDGNPIIVPEEQLQSKAKRYYFKNTFLLAPGEVFVSPFDLNMERGEIVKPLKPMIRFATPVFDSSGEKRGVVVLNYFGAQLIQNFETSSARSLGQTYLLNSDGFWLKGPRSEDEWGFMFEDGSNRTFGNTFPETWQEISPVQSGQLYNTDGMFTFTTVYPLSEGWVSSTSSGQAIDPSTKLLEAGDYYWKLVSHVSPNVLSVISRRSLGQILPLWAVLTILLVIISWILARVSVRRQQAEEMLRQSEFKYRSLFENMLDGFAYCKILLDQNSHPTDFIYLEVNQAFERLTGLKKEDVVGKKATEAIPGTKDSHPELFDIYGKVALTGKEARFDLYFEPLKRWFSISVYSPRKGYFVVVFENITKRKKTEAKLKQALTELERSNADLEQFAYVASHDLQEPLRNVSTYLQLLERRYKGRLDSDADEFIAYAVDGATHLQKIINDLLDYSRLGAHGKPFKPTNCGAVLDRTLANLKTTIEESGAVVTYGLLPTVMAEEVQLVQLFQNLIDNAIKFHGEGPPHVYVSAEQKGNEWVFSVGDNGIGIEMKYAETIFQIFQRLHSRAKYSGTGMGLAICKRIVERHGGRIWVKSQPGEGSTFYFTIPMIGDKQP